MSFSGKWIPDDKQFRQECLKIAEDLTDFKKNPVYCKFINNDNRSYETALAFYGFIYFNYPSLLSYFCDFKKNDEVGNPTLYRIGAGYISPGTLRFIKVLGDILRIEPQSIIEIGSGYGGQCKIIRSYWPDIFYSLVDIPESLAVAKAYLQDDEDLIFINCEETIASKKYDLVISDYCLSEMDKSGVDFYIETIVRYCHNGYFTCNQIGVSQYLIKQLNDLFHQVAVQPEEPKTSKHNNIIVYAMGNRYL